MSKISYEKMQQLLRIKRYQDILTYDEIVSLGINAKWKELCSKIDDPSLDPTDIFADEIEQLKNTEYSMKLMNICCLSETWEQDLYNFLKEKGLIVVFSNDYNRNSDIFEQAYPTCAIVNYPGIKEMRALVNAIKHGEGNSFTNLRRMTRDSILADSDIGFIDENGTVTKRKQIDFDYSTLTSRTLNVDGKLQDYCTEIIKFWDDVFKKDNESTETPEII